MSNTRINITAAWIALVVLALGLASDRESHFRERAQQMEFRIVIEKLKGNEGIGSRVATVSDWRREARFAAETWESISLRLTLSAAVAAVAAMNLSAWLWLVLMGGSIGGAGSAAYFAALAMGVL